MAMRDELARTCAWWLVAGGQLAWTIASVFARDGNGTALYLVLLAFAVWRASLAYERLAHRLTEGGDGD